MYEIIEMKNLFNEDEDVVVKIVNEVISTYPDQVKQYRAGKTKIINFFIGQVMKRINGSFDQKVIGKMLAGKLNVSV